MPEQKGEKVGTTWRATLPCPTCHQNTVIGYLLVNERGEHMHTRYVCTFWPSGATGRCGWSGWTVPGWDADRDDRNPPDTRDPT